MRFKIAIEPHIQPIPFFFWAHFSSASSSKPIARCNTESVLCALLLLFSSFHFLCVIHLCTWAQFHCKCLPCKESLSFFRQPHHHFLPDLEINWVKCPYFSIHAMLCNSVAPGIHNFLFPSGHTITIAVCWCDNEWHNSGNQRVQMKGNQLSHQHRQC